MQIGRGKNQANKTHDPTTHAEMVGIREMEQNLPNLRKVCLCYYTDG